MSAQIKIVRKEQRLRVSAKYEHQVIQFQGNIFDLLRHLMDQKLSGKGTFHLRSDGEIYGLEFDVRKLVPAEENEITIDAKPSSVG